jgi:hypothetical protein
MRSFVIDANGTVPLGLGVNYEAEHLLGNPLMTLLDPEVLRDAILRERSAGVVTVDYRRAEPYSAATNRVNVDKFIIELGFSPLGDQWRYICRKEAREILHRILERDLAYQSPIISSARAELLADSFVRLFSRVDAQFCTNYSWSPKGSRSRSGSGITQATFDEGIVAYDNQNIGLVWVQDED